MMPAPQNPATSLWSWVGPLFQLLRRAHLSGNGLELLVCRVIVMSLLAWLPLLALSVAEGHAWGGSVKVPFLFDVEMYCAWWLPGVAGFRGSASRRGRRRLCKLRNTDPSPASCRARCRFARDSHRGRSRGSGRRDSLRVRLDVSAARQTRAALGSPAASA